LEAGGVHTAGLFLLAPALVPTSGWSPDS